MHNLGEIKSRQLHRHTNIQPIGRAYSYNNFDSNQKQITKLNFQRSPYCENHYNLANIVNDILQLKPNTAPKRPTQSNFKNNKTEFNAINKQSIQFFTNYAQSDKHARTIPRNQQNQQSYIKYKESSLLNKHYKLLFIGNQFKEEKGLLKQSNKKINNEEFVSQGQFQTTKIPEQKIQSKSKDEFDKKEMLSDDKLEQIIDKKRRNSQYVFLPKTKLSVRTIDPLIKIKSQQFRNKSSKKIKNDLQINNELESKINENAQIIEAKIISGRKFIKIKRSVTDVRVPDFIKMSLQGYKQPEFKIKELINKKDDIQQLKNQPQFQINQNITSLADIKIENKSHDNLAGIKVKLQMKQKRKPIKTNQHVRQEREQTLIQPQQIVTKYKYKKSVSQHKKIFLQDVDHDICGWQSNQTPCPDSLNFKE